MKRQEIKHTRITELRNLAIRGCRMQLSREEIIDNIKKRCMQIGVSKVTTQNYINEVLESLQKVKQ